MRKVTLIFGLLAGAISSVFLIVFIVFWMKTGKAVDNALIGYAAMVIALSMIFFGIKSYRDNYRGGAISFGKGFQVGWLITLIASFMYAITWETYNQVSPASSEAFIAYHVECQIDKLKVKGVSAAEIERKIRDMNDFMKIYRNPAIRFGITLMEIMPMGIIITLISAALFRKKEFLAAGVSNETIFMKNGRE